MAWVDRPPNGRLAAYAKGKVEYSNANPSGAPGEAEVLTDKKFNNPSNPVDPDRMGDLTANGVGMDAVGTTLDLDLSRDESNANTATGGLKTLTRMHTVNSFLGYNTNKKKNMFLGEKTFNGWHDRAAEEAAKIFAEHFGFFALGGKEVDAGLSAAETIENNGGTYELESNKKATTFPDDFLSTIPVKSGGKWRADINTELFSEARCLQYLVEVEYNEPDHAAAIQAAIEDEYDNLFPGYVPAYANYQTELEDATDAYQDLYATRVIVTHKVWAPNLTTLTPGNSVAADAIDWRERGSANIPLSNVNLPHYAYLTMTPPPAPKKKGKVGAAAIKKAKVLKPIDFTVNITR